MKLSLICRPISSPILSKRARHETPKLGSTNSRAAIPHTRSALTAFLDLNPVPVQSIQDLPAPPVDDVLCAPSLSINVSRGIYNWIATFCRGLRLELDPMTGARIRPFLQSVSVPPMSDCFEDTPNVPEFLKHASPPRCLPSLDSPPLFSRIAQGRSTKGRVRNNTKSGVSNLTRISDLASILPVASPQLIDGEDGDINAHLMEIVSGRSEFKSPQWI